MALTDNRNQLQDSENTANISADSDATPTGNTTESGLLIEGSNATSLQVTNSEEHILYDQDTAEATFNLDLSDSTVYIAVKDNLQDTYANNGAMVCLNDGADGAGGDDIGYSVGGADAGGLFYRRRYNIFKLDVSEAVTTPGNHFVFNGTEAGLNHASILQVGYGSIHLAKAQGSVPNTWMDGIYYIANDSYAATINGGTSGTPETMTDVVGDDETSGMGMFSNPKGTEFDFFAPTEFGTPSGTANSYFTGSDEQWFLLGDNGGGRSLAAGHFPFRFIGNGTGTNSIVLTRVVIINTGARSTWLMDDANMDTIELASCSMISCGTISLPSSGGTSRSTLNCTFIDCDQITNNGADMTGSSVLVSNVVADTGALLYNETTDPDGELDDMTFSQGATAHHAIDFGTNVTNNITLRNIEFTDFDTGEDANGAALRFLATTGSLNCNLVNCTVNGATANASNLYKDDAAGIDVTLVFDPFTFLVNVKDEDMTNIQNARVFVETAETQASGEIYRQGVTTLTQAAGTATCTTSAVHGLETGDQVVIRGAQPDGYNKVATATVTSTTIFTYPVDSGLSSPATGTPLVSYVALHGLTDASGNISLSRTWGADQLYSGWARKSNASSPFYSQANISVTVSSSAATTVNSVLGSDE